MAVTLTRDGLSVAMRLATSDSTAAALPVGQLATVDRMLAVATALVEGYAPSAPEAIQNEAAIRVAGYLYDKSPGDPSSVQSPLIYSQAAALLTGYRTRRLRGPDGSSSTSSTPSTPTPSNGEVGVDQTARDAAADAQAAAEAAEVLASGKVNEAGATAAARAVTADWAEEGNIELPPASKSRLATSTERGAVQGAGTDALVDEETGTDIRGWSIAHIFRAVTRRVKSWARTDATDLVPPVALFGQNHPVNRSVVVNADGNFQLIEGGTPGAGGGALETTTEALQSRRADILVDINSLPITEAAWSTLYDVDGTTEIVCPETGEIEFLAYAKSGLRDNAVAYAKFPASELRLSPTNGPLHIALAANRWFGIQTNNLTSQFLQVKGQDGQDSTDGNYAVRICHITEQTVEVVTGVTGSTGEGADVDLATIVERVAALESAPSGGGDTAVIADSDIAVTTATWVSTGLVLPTTGYVMGELFQESSTGGGAYANPTFAYSAAALRALNPGTVGNADGQSVNGRSNTRFAANSNIELGRDASNRLLIRLSVANTRNSQLNYVLAVGTPS